VQRIDVGHVLIARRPPGRVLLIGWRDLPRRRYPKRDLLLRGRRLALRIQPVTDNDVSMNALVRRVKRRIDMRIVRFRRST
jgi:hypothetical protein